VTLRTRFFALFTLLAVLPLVAVGAFGFVRSMRAVESLVATQVGEIARSATRELQDRYAQHEANLLLLAQNAETQTLLQALISGDSSTVTAARATAVPYLDHAWQVLGAQYEWIELREANGRVLYRMGGDPGAATAAAGVPASSGSSGWLRLQEPIVDPERSLEVGAVIAGVIPDAMLPFEALERRFGASGYSVVFDRSTGRVLYHPRHAYWQRSIDEVAGPTGWNVDLTAFEEPEGSMSYREAETTRVAVFQSLASPAWTVLASGSVNEFSAPFVRSRAANLLLILSLTVAVWIAYTLLARRATRSLAALTEAADRVGAGNLTPELPPAGTDEVGRLTTAFRLMMAKVRESLQQIEASRQMAAVGQFASQISHEIRNPLAGLMNCLTRLSKNPDEANLRKYLPLMDTASRQIQETVSRYLRFSSAPSKDQKPFCVNKSMEIALSLVRPRLESRDISVQLELEEGLPTVEGDSTLLQQVLLNLLINAVDAIDREGIISIRTFRQDGNVVLMLGDTGPGIPKEDLEKLFDPFFTTKEGGGTGLGLAISREIIKQFHGSIHVTSKSGTGTTFEIQLPTSKG